MNLLSFDTATLNDLSLLVAFIRASCISNAMWPRTVFLLFICVLLYGGHQVPVSSRIVVSSFASSEDIAEDALLSFNGTSTQTCPTQMLEELCTVDLPNKCHEWANQQMAEYNCTYPGLSESLRGKHAGITANYLSFATEISSPHFVQRAREFEACTGGNIIFSEANNVFEDTTRDLGTRTSRGSELYDAYLTIYSLTAEASSLGLIETLNERIRTDNQRLKYQDILPMVRYMSEYRKDGVTQIDTLMLDGDFFVPIIRLDLLEKYDLPLPNTWEEVAEYAKFFNGTDLNDDGDPDDFGFCHFPRVGSGFYDLWWAEAMYSTWSSSDQTQGINQGFFFDEETLEPQVGEGFKRAAQVWKDLWNNGADGCITSNFMEGRCAIGYAPPGCWKGVFVNSDGVSRKNESGAIVWRPTMKSGEYAEPYRFKPFGSMRVVDRKTGNMVLCRPDLCPKAETIPIRGHHGDDDRAKVLPPSPYAGVLVNRSPFFWSGGFTSLIRKSADNRRKDLMWDFFVYVNSPETSVLDVVQPSWLDSWRYSQLSPGRNFLGAGWSVDSYQEHQSIMLWALSNDANGAYNIRLPGVYKYTFEVVGREMQRYIADEISLNSLAQNIKEGWTDVSLSRGLLEQLAIYRASLGLEELTTRRQCELHRDILDSKDPSICEAFDPVDSSLLLYSLLSSFLAVLLSVAVVLYLTRKYRSADSIWRISLEDLHFADPPEILGRGTFGLVVLGEYRGTSVAVKRVLPPQEVPSLRLSSRDGFAASMSSELVLSLDDSSILLNSLDLETDESTHSQTPPKGMSRMLAKSNPMVQGSFRLPARNSHKGSQNTLPTPKKSHSQLKTEFVSEMRHLAKLRHPCITMVIGAVIKKTPDPMLVMEYMEHGSLYDILHNNTVLLDGSLVLPILQDIARGTRFLHAATPTVIHGDLKAANVLVDGRFRAKVADFGFSAKKNTASFGTPFWMAPELLSRKSPCSTESDVYAFGILLYEVYSRKEPYEGEPVKRVLREVMDIDIQKRPPIPKGCPPLIASIMADCGHADAEKRPNFEEIDLHLKRVDSSSVEPVHQTRASRNEDLVYQLFPKHIAEALQDGRQVGVSFKCPKWLLTQRMIVSVLLEAGS